MEIKDLDTLWNSSDPAASEVAFRERLSGAPELEPATWAWIARAQALQGKFQESRASLERAEKLLNERPAEFPVSAKIRWLLERGRLYILERTPAQGRSFLAEGWTLALESHEDPLAIEIAQLMAANEPQKVQQEWIMRAISIAERSAMPAAKHRLGSLYSSLGWKYYDLRQYEKALDMLRDALKNFREQGTRREAFVAQWSIGKILRVVGKTDEALAIQKALVLELDGEGERDGRLYEELAECLTTLKRTEEAQSYFELAYRELSSDVWVTDNQPLKLKRMKDLGKVKS